MRCQGMHKDSESAKTNFSNWSQMRPHFSARGLGTATLSDVRSLSTQSLHATASRHIHNTLPYEPILITPTQSPHPGSPRFDLLQRSVGCHSQHQLNPAHADICSLHKSMHYVLLTTLGWGGDRIGCRIYVHAMTPFRDPVHFFFLLKCGEQSWHSC